MKSTKQYLYRNSDYSVQNVVRTKLGTGLYDYVDNNILDKLRVKVAYPVWYVMLSKFSNQLKTKNENIN